MESGSRDIITDDISFIDYLGSKRGDPILWSSLFPSLFGGGGEEEGEI